MKVVKVECCEDCPWSRWSLLDGRRDGIWQCSMPGEYGEDWIVINDHHTIPDWCTLPDGMTVETSTASTVDIASQWDAAEQEKTIEQLGAELHDSESKWGDCEFDLIQEKKRRRELEAKIAEQEKQLREMAADSDRDGMALRNMRMLARELAAELDCVVDEDLGYYASYTALEKGKRRVALREKARAAGLLEEGR